MKFTASTGLAGRFTTVRLGLPDLSQGEEVQLEGTRGEPLGRAVVADAWAGDLALLPGSILEMEQNPLHRTYSGLIVGLRGAYRVDDLTPNSKVTAYILDTI